MDSHKLSYYKNLLILERDSLSNKIKNAGIPEEANCGDEIDIQSSLSNNNMHFELIRRSSVLIRRINEALLKISDQTFGLCESCDEYIEEMRLKTKPFAHLCVPCQEFEEIKVRSFGKNSRCISVS